MSNDKPFATFPGKFLCKNCNEEVKSMRLWRDTGDATWMCTKKHVSRVQLVAKKKTKKDYENE
jgi:hypothetical protein